MRVFQPICSSVVAVLALAAGTSLLSGQTALPDSPFLGGNGSAVDRSNGPTEPFELTGISVVGEKTFVSIYDSAEKHSHWIAVGGTVGEIHVMSCDLVTDQSLVRIGGKLKVLTLRAPSIAAAPAVSPSAEGGSALIGSPMAGAGAVAPAVSSSDEDQAREARMLVTDLLEISMQQRKAYEEAQKKAAESADKP